MIKKFFIILVLLFITFSCSSDKNNDLVFDSSSSNIDKQQTSSLPVGESLGVRDKKEQQELKVLEKEKVFAEHYINNLVSLNENEEIYKVYFKKLDEKEENKLIFLHEEDIEEYDNFYGEFIIEVTTTKKYDKIIYESYYKNQYVLEKIDNYRKYDYSFKTKNTKDLPNYYNKGKFIYYKGDEIVKEDIIMPLENEGYIVLNNRNEENKYYSDIIEINKDFRFEANTKVFIINKEFKIFGGRYIGQLIDTKKYISFLNNYSITTGYEYGIQKIRNLNTNQIVDKIDYDFQIPKTIKVGDLNYKLVENLNYNLNPNTYSYFRNSSIPKEISFYKEDEILEDLNQKITEEKNKIKENYINNPIDKEQSEAEKTHNYPTNIIKEDFEAPYYNIIFELKEFPSIIFKYELELESKEKPISKVIGVVKIDKKYQNLIENNGDVKNIDLMKEIFGDSILLGNYHIMPNIGNYNNRNEELVKKINDALEVDIIEIQATTETHGWGTGVYTEKFESLLPIINVKKAVGDYYTISLLEPFLIAPYNDKINN